MILTQTDYKKIKGYRPTKLDAVIDEFIAMNVEAVEITNFEYVSAASCKNALTKAIERRHFGQIHVFTKEGSVYMVNDSVINKEV